MKTFLAIILAFALTTSVAYADQASNSWSWQSFKERVVAKITSIINSFRGEPAQKEASAPTQPAPAQVPEPAAQPAPEQQAAQGQKAEVAHQEPAAPAEPVQTSAAAPAPVPAAPVAAGPSMFDRLKSWVKSFTAPEKEEPTVQFTPLKNSARAVASIEAGRVATPAVPYSDDNLVMGHNDIPVYPFKANAAKLKKEQVKKIPLLNVGQEEILDSNTFKIVGIPPFPTVSAEPIKALEGPELASSSEFKKMLGDDVVPATIAEKIDIPVLEPAKKVTGDKINRLVYTLVPDAPYTSLPVVKFTEEDLKLLRGLILFEKKDQCHVAAGIFSDLLNSTSNEVKENSRFHLGLCLHEMNLPTEALFHLNKVIRSKDPKYTGDAVKAAVEDLQLQNESFVAEALLASDEKLFPKESLPLVNYVKAKYFIRKNQPQKALETAVQVPANTPPFYKAQYVAAIAEYEAGKTDASLERQKNMAQELTKNGKDKNVLALFQMNLGRAAFQKGKYKDSLEAFQKVPKENSLWIQSLLEEAWVQLQFKDMAGAIGNMHSIQSPYFNGVYKPESYVLRSIAYLSICQYPDAFKSISYLEHTYQPWLDKLAQFNSSHNSSQIYAAVLKHLQSKANQDVEGLPFQVMREAERQRDFLNAQESINQLIDEHGGYPFVKSLVEKDRKALVARRNAAVVKAAQLRDKIRKVNTIPDGMKNFNQWRFELTRLEDFLSVYDFKVQTLHEGLDGLNRLTTVGQNRIEESREKVKDQAGKILKDHFAKMAKELRQSLDNDELLKYEVYAGSGENIRYKMAGGKTGGSANMSDRKPAGQKWDFDGEFWEDEIGNYRSSLKNNCQNVAGVKQ